MSIARCPVNGEFCDFLPAFPPEGWSLPDFTQHCRTRTEESQTLMALCGVFVEVAQSMAQINATNEVHEFPDIPQRTCLGEFCPEQTNSFGETEGVAAILATVEACGNVAGCILDSSATVVVVEVRNA